MRTTRIVVSLIALALASGCADRSDKTGASRDKLLIAVVPKATSHEFWKSVHAGAVEGEKQAGVEIIWKGPITESDREAQINLLQDFIAQGVSGICLAPLDSQALQPVVREAKTAGVPVLIFDSGLDDLGDAISFVATDNFHGGEIAGRHLGKLLGGKGRVIVLRYNVGSQSSHEREEGCLAALAKEFPAIEVISSNEYAGDTADKALVKSQQLLLTFGDRVDGVFTPAQHVSTGMLRALEEQNLAGKVKFIGFDPGPELVTALAAGKMHGLVLQDPVRMASLAVTTMAAHLRGEKVAPRISTGETLATPENMNEPAIQKLLNPPLLD
ncbi:MAG TPA: substrate-binding domain-containing protein [Pirellulales bacterium]|jgi:ribose transport system substrate-binding protein|nr:substrate-binding domain-containing protein [Pirellulales bacterium]